jgi:N-acetylglucosaminyl-diphospho-decaprenol L-rhamnosyltransferase
MDPVGAVVVNYNAAPHLVGCVESLLAEGVAPILVVDNSSWDDSAAVLARSGLPARFQSAGRNLGYGGGANVGLRQLDTPWVLVLNPDTVVHPGMIKALVAALEQDDRRGIAGPRIENTDGTLYPSARTFPTLGDAVGHAFLGMIAPGNRWSRRYKMLGWDHADQAEVDWISGACFLARRQAI